MRAPNRSVLSALLAALLILVLALVLAPPAGAAPLSQGSGTGGLTLGDWKAILTTVLLVVGLLQFLGQAIVRGWIRIGGAPKKLLAGLHRPGGILAFLLTFAGLGLGIYIMYGPGGVGPAAVSTAGLLLHAVFGGLLALVLVVKAIISNFARRSLRLNVPLGIAAGVLTLAVWLTSAMPRFFGLYW